MININKFTNHSGYEAAARGLSIPNASVCTQEDEVHYNRDLYSRKYLTFEAITSGTFKLSGNSVSYSLDDGATWTTLASNTNSPTVNAGEKIMFKATISSGTVGKFASTSTFKAYGNVMSLLYGDNFVGQVSLSGKTGIFIDLFNGCTGLTDAGDLILPATELDDECYEIMFQNCTSLVKAPMLPATTLAWGCYQNMFEGCTSLATAPELPATTLAGECYNGMFYGCTSLVNTPKLPATALAWGCYYYMFSNCTSLKKAQNIPATVMAENCCSSMFNGCSNLHKAPNLQAATMASHCCSNMFRGCTSLKKAPELPSTVMANSCYLNMFSGCTSLIKAPELPATTLADYCYESMFEGCTSLEWAPYLPATELASGCYSTMFYGCTNLQYVMAMFLSNPNDDDWTYAWLKNVAANGTFVKNPKAEWNVTGQSGIPAGWRVVTSGKVGLVLFIDDFDDDNNVVNIPYWTQEAGYGQGTPTQQDIDEYVNDMDENPMSFEMDSYVLLSYGFEWGGKKYYLWGHVEPNCTKVRGVAYLLTDTDDYYGLFHKSLAYSLDNLKVPYVAILGDDFSIYKSPYKLLVTVKYINPYLYMP